MSIPCRIARGGLAALLLASPALAAAEPTSGALTQEVNTTLGLSSSQVLPVIVAGDPSGTTTAIVEVGGNPLYLQLAPHSVRGEDFEVLAQGADGSWTPVPAEPSRTVRGEVSGLAGSSVAGSLTADGGLEAVIELPDGTSYWVQPLAGVVDGAAPGQHVLYEASDVIDTGRRCGLEALPNPYPSTGLFQPKGQTSKGSALSVAELACDADFEYFTDYGSVGATQNRIESVVNTMNAQYEAEVGITHTITTILVRTSASQPYTSTDAVTLLNQFRDEWNANQSGVQRDVAQLFTGKEIQGGTIGIAWVGVVCNLSFAYGVVQSDFNGAFSCATDLSAHELGHNWDADHCSCTSNTMNPFITCANTFHPTFSIPEIISYRDSVSCLDGGGGPGGGDPTSIHVSSIVPSTVGVGKGQKKGRAVVTIVDDQGNPVSGASVTGTFSGDLNQTVSGTTGAGGTVTLDTTVTKKGKTKFTFCVDSVSGALPYAPGDNVRDLRLQLTVGHHGPGTGPGLTRVPAPRRFRTGWVRCGVSHCEFPLPTQVRGYPARLGAQCAIDSGPLAKG